MYHVRISPYCSSSNNNSSSNNSSSSSSRSSSRSSSSSSSRSSSSCRRCCCCCWTQYVYSYENILATNQHTTIRLFKAIMKKTHVLISTLWMNNHTLTYTWCIIIPYVPRSEPPYIGDGHPPLIGTPYNGYINPYYWVDDHPLLYGNTRSYDPSTYDFTDQLLTTS